MDTDNFKNAQFWDRFLTADGRKAVLLYFWGNPTSCAILFVDKFDRVEYQLNGMREGDTTTNGWDIITRCRADGWEPLPTERKRLAPELSSAREMLATCLDDLLMRTSWENRIKYLEQQIANLKG